MGMQLMTEEVEKISRRVGLRMNAGKCKIMVSNNWEDSTVITAEGTTLGFWCGRRLLLPGQLLIENRKLRQGMHDKNWKGGKCIRETSKHLEKQEYQPRRENQALWVTCRLNPALWCRIMATICHTNGSSSPLSSTGDCWLPPPPIGRLHVKLN